MMIHRLICFICLFSLVFNLGISSPVHALDLSRQPPETISIELGGPEGELVFHPDQLVFENGRLYKLALINPSPLKHYFTAPAFADSIWTRKLEVAGVEIKGHVTNLELKPGASADWFFIPLHSGSYSLICTVPGHAEAGMVGTILIQD